MFTIWSTTLSAFSLLPTMSWVHCDQLAGTIPRRGHAIGIGSVLSIVDLSLTPKTDPSGTITPNSWSAISATSLEMLCFVSLSTRLVHTLFASLLCPLLVLSLLSIPIYARCPLLIRCTLSIVCLYTGLVSFVASPLQLGAILVMLLCGMFLVLIQLLRFSCM